MLRFYVSLFCRRVLSKEIDPTTLVNLSHEDLASTEMSAALEELKKDGLKMVCNTSSLCDPVSFLLPLFSDSVKYYIHVYVYA